MRASVHKRPLIVTALIMSFGLTACSGESEANAEGAGEASMAAETSERESAERASAEVGGEQAEGGESAEGHESGESGREGEGEHGESGEGREGGGEHDEGGESGEEGESEHGGPESEHDEGEEGEEPGIYIGRADTWDMTRRGARLILSLNPASNAFVGTVENTTNQTLCAVRVEVHLSGGPELGPTPRTDIPSGGTTPITLPTEGVAVDTWTAHPEMSACSGE